VSIGVLRPVAKLEVSYSAFERSEAVRISGADIGWDRASNSIAVAQVADYTMAQAVIGELGCMVFEGSLADLVSLPVIGMADLGWMGSGAVVGERGLAERLERSDTVGGSTISHWLYVLLPLAGQLVCSPVLQEVEVVAPIEGGMS
jgi:hypothetical protein